MQYTVLMPYFLCAWRDELESKNRLSRWSCLRSHALASGAPRSRQIVNTRNALHPTISVVTAVFP